MAWNSRFHLPGKLHIVHRVIDSGAVFEYNYVNNLSIHGGAVMHDKVGRNLDTFGQFIARDLFILAVGLFAGYGCTLQRFDWQVYGIALLFETVCSVLYVVAMDSHMVIVGAEDMAKGLVPWGGPYERMSHEVPPKLCKPLSFVHWVGIVTFGCWLVQMLYWLIPAFLHWAVTVQA